MLFAELAIAEAVPVEAARFCTPLGDLLLEVDSGDGHPLGLGMPVEQFSLPRGGRLLRFNHPALEAELVRAPVKAFVPAGMPLDGCEVGMWRVRARIDLPSGLGFSCRFAPSARWSENEGPRGGEWLDSQAWNDTRHKVAIGTEGGDAFALRGRSGDWLPSGLGRNERWPDLPHLHRADGSVDWLQLAHFREDGMEVRLPSIGAGERFQCHFLCAWAPSSADEIATWLAVEQLPHELLEQLSAPESAGSINHS